MVAMYIRPLSNIRIFASLVIPGGPAESSGKSCPPPSGSQSSVSCRPGHVYVACFSRPISIVSRSRVCFWCKLCRTVFRLNSAVLFVASFLALLGEALLALRFSMFWRFCVCVRFFASSGVFLEVSVGVAFSALSNASLHVRTKNYGSPGRRLGPTSNHPWPFVRVVSTPWGRTIQFSGVRVECPVLSRNVVSAVIRCSVKSVLGTTGAFTSVAGRAALYPFEGSSQAPCTGVCEVAC